MTAPAALREYVDDFGNISVSVKLGKSPRTSERETGANARPPLVAQFLRDLADDIEGLT